MPDEDEDEDVAGDPEDIESTTCVVLRWKTQREECVSPVRCPVIWKSPFMCQERSISRII